MAFENLKKDCETVGKILIDKNISSKRLFRETLHKKQGGRNIMGHCN